MPRGDPDDAACRPRRPRHRRRDGRGPGSGFKLTTNFGLVYTNGDYGTERNTNVEMALTTVSLQAENLKFSVTMPYMRIAGRGLVVFDAAGNPSSSTGTPRPRPMCAPGLATSI